MNVLKGLSAIPARIEKNSPGSFSRCSNYSHELWVTYRHCIFPCASSSIGQSRTWCVDWCWWELCGEHQGELCQDNASKQTNILIHKSKKKYKGSFCVLASVSVSRLELCFLFFLPSFLSLVPLRNFLTLTVVTTSYSRIKDLKIGRGSSPAFYDLLPRRKLQPGTSILFVVWLLGQDIISLLEDTDQPSVNSMKFKTGSRASKQGIIAGRRAVEWFQKKRK